MFFNTEPFDAKKFWQAEIDKIGNPLQDALAEARADAATRPTRAAMIQDHMNDFEEKKKQAKIDLDESIARRDNYLNGKK